MDLGRNRAPSSLPKGNRPARRRRQNELRFGIATPAFWVRASRCQNAMRLSAIAPTSVAIDPHPWTRMILSGFLRRNPIGSVPPNDADPITASFGAAIVQCQSMQTHHSAVQFDALRGHFVPTLWQVDGLCPNSSSNSRMRNPLRGYLILRCTRYADSPQSCSPEMARKSVIFGVFRVSYAVLQMSHDVVQQTSNVKKGA